PGRRQGGRVAVPRPGGGPAPRRERPSGHPRALQLGARVRKARRPVPEDRVITPQRVLVMSPHTDDAELGCGGTMARWIEEGAEVYEAAFSTAELSLPEGSKPYRLKDECHLALDELG